MTIALIIAFVCAKILTSSSYAEDNISNDIIAPRNIKVPNNVFDAEITIKSDILASEESSPLAVTVSPPPKENKLDSRKGRYMRHIQRYKPTRFRPRGNYRTRNRRRRPQSSRPQQSYGYPNRLNLGRRPPSLVSQPNTVGLSKYKSYKKGYKKGNPRFKRPDNNYRPEIEQTKYSNHYNNENNNYADYDQQDQDGDDVDDDEQSEEYDEDVGDGSSYNTYKIEDVEPSLYFEKSKQKFPANPYNDVLPLSSGYQEFRRPLNMQRMPYDYERQISSPDYRKLGRMRPVNYDPSMPADDVRYNYDQRESQRRPTSITDIIKWSTTGNNDKGVNIPMVGHYHEMVAPEQERNIVNYFIDTMPMPHQQFQIPFEYDNNLKDERVFEGTHILPNFHKDDSEKLLGSMNDVSGRLVSQNSNFVYRINKPNYQDKTESFYDRAPHGQESQLLPSTSYGMFHTGNEDVASDVEYRNAANLNPVIHSMFNNKKITDNNWQEAVYSSRYRKPNFEDNDTEGSNVGYSYIHQNALRHLPTRDSTLSKPENIVDSLDKTIERTTKDQLSRFRNDQALPLLSLTHPDFHKDNLYARLSKIQNKNNGENGNNNDKSIANNENFGNNNSHKVNSSKNRNSYEKEFYDSVETGTVQNPRSLLEEGDLLPNDLIAYMSANPSETVVGKGNRAYVDSREVYKSAHVGSPSKLIDFPLSSSRQISPATSAVDQEMIITFDDRITSDWKN